MGDSLVVFTVPEEVVGWVRPNRMQVPKVLHQHGLEQSLGGITIPEGGIWEPPREPRSHEWWRTPELRRGHTQAMRQSLENFLNNHLGQLDHMVRTGWWVLGKVRVRVVECRPVPEREMRAFARSFGKGLPKSRKPIGPKATRASTGPRRGGGLQLQVRWPRWLAKYEVWHPLHSTAYGVYKAEAFARAEHGEEQAHRLFAAAYRSLKRFEDAGLPQRVRVAAGDRAAAQFSQRASSRRTTRPVRGGANGDERPISTKSAARQRNVRRER